MKLQFYYLFNYYRLVNGICLADSGYAQSQFVYTPHPNPITNARKKYNYAHVRTRNVVERVNGLLKSRFRCLCRKLGTATITSSNIIVACVVLHNICIKYKIELNQEEIQFQPENDDDEIVNDRGNNGFNIRNSFINRNFM